MSAKAGLICSSGAITPVVSRTRHTRSAHGSQRLIGVCRLEFADRQPMRFQDLPRFENARHAEALYERNG
jgi:hypothetical protein